MIICTTLQLSDYMYFFKVWCDMKLRYIPPSSSRPSIDASLFSLGPCSTPAENKLKIHIYLKFPLHYQFLNMAMFVSQLPELFCLLLKSITNIIISTTI